MNRHRVELNSQRGLQLAHFAIERAGDSFAFADEAARLVFVNQKVCQFLGYSREELLSMAVPDLDPNLTPQAWRGYWERLRKDKTGFFERTIQVKGGAQVPVEVTVNHFAIEGEEYLCAVMRDVRERKEAERALRESQAHYQSLFDEALEGMFRTRADGTIIDVNPAFARLTGHDEPNELRGKRMQDLYVTPGQHAGVQTRYGAHGTVEGVEVQWKRRDGGRITVLLYARELVGEDGRPTHYQGFVQDVTEERARAARERTLLEHKEQLELVIDGTRLGFWDWNLATDEVTFSERWARMLGYEIDELDPHMGGYRGLVHADDRTLLDEKLRAHLAGELPYFEAVHRMRHRDGTYRHILNRGKVFGWDEDGRPSRFCGTHTDISGEKEAERAALEANRAKTQFLASMSHELRTPLNAILGLSEALLERTYGGLSERQEKSLKTIRESGDLLLHLINDVLDIARIEAGKLSIDPRNTELRPLVQECISFVRKTAADKNLQLTVEMPAGHHEVLADPRRLRQLLLNLLTNALKFSPPQGTVSVGARASRQPGYTELWVSDEGTGVPDRDRERIFEPFVSLGEDSTTRPLGVGLGLALVRRIAALHGGAVKVESEVGKGSTFVVTLPSAHREARATAVNLPRREIEHQLKEHRRERAQRDPLILIAEDSEANALVVADYLISKKFRVRVVRDGVTSVTAAADPEVALVIMDIGLPGLDGFEALRQIRAQEKADRPKPIIAVTAYAMPEDEEKCLAAGATRYVPKPVKLKELAETIETLLRFDAGRRTSST